MKCHGCHLWVCKDISCGFPSQSCCSVCAPELLTVVHLRQGNEDWWTGTPGSTSREYRHQVLSELLTCVFLKFGENSQCLNNDTARSCLRLWVNAIDPQSLEQAKTSCNSLPQAHPTAVVPVHPWQVGSKSQYHVKIVLPTEDMQQPRSLIKRRQGARTRGVNQTRCVSVSFQFPGDAGSCLLHMHCRQYPSGSIVLPDSVIFFLQSGWSIIQPLRQRSR